MGSLNALQHRLEDLQASSPGGKAPEGTTRPAEILVVLPAYNEEENLGALLRRINEDLSEDRLPYRVLVVDDGSADRTPQILAACAVEYPLHVRRHERNLGLGATIRDGLLQASEMAGPRDIVVTMDADETHTPGLVLRMVRMIREGHDVVIASRYQPQARVVGLSFPRRVISYGASILMRAVFPTAGVRDYTCGFRAYRASVLAAAIRQYGDAFLNQDGFQCMVDILLKLRRMPVIFGEVPMILRYDRKKGASKMRLARTTYRTLRLLLRRRLGLQA